MKVIVAIGLAVLSVLGMPAAWADKTQDNTYLNHLLMDGFDLDAIGRPLLIQVAHDICSQLDQGNMSLKAMAAMVANEVPSVPYKTLQQAALIGDAMGAYCPQYQHQMN